MEFKTIKNNNFIKMPQSFERLFEIKKESLKLLENQGFDIDQEKVLFDYSVEDFKKYYVEVLPYQDENLIVDFLKKEDLTSTRSYMSNIYSSVRNPDVQVIVYFGLSSEKKVSESDIAYFCRMIQHFDVTSAILITEVPLSSAAEGLCTEFVPCRVKQNGRRYGCFIQHFQDNELFFNPMEHTFVPIHRLLSEEEIDELIKVEKIRPNQLPQMSALDPIAKRLGARPGNGTHHSDVVEITRKILMSGTLLNEEIFYRGIYMPPKEKKDRVTRK
jgi:DNA-directed RNA polymerase subunit H (RpoH/RPB5)